jgi:hypothetical protein
LFILSAIQTISFILIGNFILEIKGMTLSYWLVLFTTSCFANVLGLNISSAFNSVVTIYILIPFIIIPQLLFSGVLVKFDKLHINSNSSREFVPVIGDLMAARWSFEALAVRQFKDNKFEKNFLKSKIDESQNDYYGSLLINSKLKLDLMICRNYKDSTIYRDEVNKSFKRLNYHIPILAEKSKIKFGKWKDSLTAEKFDSIVDKSTLTFLDSSKKYFMSLQKLATSSYNKIMDSLKTELGEEGRIDLNNSYENTKLKEVILDQFNPEKIHKTPDKYIQKANPGYMKATSKFGRAHFYAPYKMIGNYEIDTYEFNLLVLWLVTLFLYVILYFKLIQKIITFFGTLRFARSEKKE